MSFEDLGLSRELLRAVSEAGYTVPTPIQAQAIPAVLRGVDLLGGAQTGTGKTAGFVLPILHLLAATPTAAPPGRKSPRALILAPTRELAVQIEESVRTYGKYTRQSSTAVFGGVGFIPQVNKLKRGVDVLVATPGRLLDHVQQRTVDLSRVEVLVLDEADRMLDMGFIPDIKRIMAVLPKQRQSLLFSATFSNEIKGLAQGFLRNPEVIEVARRNAPIESVKQLVYPVARERKRELLSHLIGVNRWTQVLTFTRTKHGADRLAEQLERDGISALAIHGNKSQGARTRALAQFKKGALQVLCATDIAARGIDIDRLPRVVNYDLPNVPADYVHRIGRTGRAGETGDALSLVSPDERGLLRDIERLIGKQIPREIITGYESSGHDSEERAEKPRGRGNAGQGRRQETGRSNAGGQSRYSNSGGGKGQGGNKGQGGYAQRTGHGASSDGAQGSPYGRQGQGQAPANDGARDGARHHSSRPNPGNGNTAGKPAYQGKPGAGRDRDRSRDSAAPAAPHAHARPPKRPHRKGGFSAKPLAARAAA